MRVYLCALLLAVTSIGYAHTGHHHRVGHHYPHAHHHHHHPHVYHYHLSAAPAYYKVGQCMHQNGYVPGDFDPTRHHRGHNHFYHREGQANLRVEYYCFKPKCN